MDDSPAPEIARLVAQPGAWAEKDQKLIHKDRVPRTPFGRVVTRSEVVYKIATRREELYAALGLVYKSYVRAGLSARHPYRMRVTPYHVLPTTEVFVAVKEGEVISTVSLIRDGELGLPMESLYGKEVESYRGHEFSLAEVSCLADCQEGQKRSASVVIRLMGLMAQSAKRRGVDQLLIAVHPRHAKFYERFIGFESIGKERLYRTVCDKPAVAMALDLNWLPIYHPQVYARFFGAPFSDEVLAYHPMSDGLRSELSLVVEANRAGCAGSELEELLVAC